MSSWIKTAKAGDKVCCVNDNPHPFTWDQEEAPKIGAVYTISDIWIEEGLTAFDLVEIKRSDRSRKHWSMFGLRVGYSAHRFRPVQPRKTDISIFTRILNTAPSEHEEA